jgi:hypothetical protein
MSAANLSNAQSLRIIGQALDPLGINAFDLRKSGDDYTIWVKRKDSEKKPAEAIHFATSQILWTHVARALKRKTSDGVTDPHNLSFLLRVLGHHLDNKAVDDFMISWSTKWVKVMYGKKEENFILPNLYEFGTGMYLKRPNHHTAK